MIDYNNPNTNWMPQGYDPYKGMSNDDKLKAGCLQMATFIAMLIGGLLLCALLGSCTTTKYVPVIETHTDTMLVTQHHRDSIYLHDSIRVSEKGDTVKIERWHTQYRDRWHTDTIYKSRTDSVPVPYPVTEYVERKPSAIERGLMIVGCLALFGLIIFAAVKLRRFLP